MQKVPKAIIYTRVSTEEQAENGTSLATQEQACIEKAARLNAQIVAPVFRDEGISGGTYLGRPNLQAALAMLEMGEANLLIAYDVSRLSRDVEHHAIIARRIKAAGGRVAYCTQDFSDNADGELSAGILKQFAQWERRKIRERAMQGHKKQAESGLQTYRNLSPLGYHVVTKQDVLTGQYPAGTVGKYQVVESEAALVQGMFQKVAAGQSLNGLAKWLNEQEIPTPQGGKCWRPSTLRAILINPVYKGTALVGRVEVVTDETRREKGFKLGYSLRQRADEECIPITSPALVTPEMWQVVQERLTENKARMAGRKGRRYLLSGLLRCPKCGNRAAGKRASNGSFCYMCCQKYVCNKASLGGAKTEQIIINGMLELGEYPASLEDALREYTQRERGGEPAEEQARLQSELEALQQREKAVVEAQIAGIAAGADPAVYAAIFAEISQDRKRMQERLAVLKAETKEDGFDPKDAAGIIARAIEDLRYVLLSKTVEPFEKNEVLASVVKAIYPESKEQFNILLQVLPGSGLTVQQVEAYWNPTMQYNSFSLWMPLQEASVENGCMWFVPGSHRQEVEPHHCINNDPRIHGLEIDAADTSSAVACPIPAGGCTIHTNRTLHYAGPNHSDIPRRAYILGYGLAATHRTEPRAFPWNEQKQTPREERAREAAKKQEIEKENPKG